ncbi:MAG: VOC family protein [Solirubrobacterales bacterium]
MKLEGIHHITAITGDARKNVEFYVGTLGLRLVKKTVNQDDPTVYHLFYGDERGDPGMDLTFFEYPGAVQGRAGAGMVHTIGWRVGSDATLDFWEQRLGAEGFPAAREDGGLSFKDPEGLRHLLTVYEGDQPALTPIAPDIPAEHALQGFDGVRAYAGDPTRSEALLAEVLGFERSAPAAWTVGGDQRSSYYVYDPAPADPGIQGAGSVHHVAFATYPDDQERWQRHMRDAGAHATPVIDRFYFKSIYFREPSGVLFELATMGPGFTADEPLEELGLNLSLPPDFEHLRDRLAGVLTPLPDPRGERTGSRGA